MTTPTQPAPTQPVTVHPVAVPSTVRALISVFETAGFIVFAVLQVLNNGADTHNSLIAAALAAIMHGVNHNAGGSPV